MPLHYNPNIAQRIFLRVWSWVFGGYMPYSPEWALGRQLWRLRLWTARRSAQRHGCDHPIGWRSAYFQPDYTLREHCVRCGKELSHETTT